MPASHYQWLDRVPDLVGLSAAAPQDFPFLLDNAANRGCSLLLLAGSEKLVQYRNGEISGPGQGGNFFERLDGWFRAESDCAQSNRAESNRAEAGSAESDSTEPDSAEPDSAKISRHAAEAPVTLPTIPFTGGWFIYLGYEMAARIEHKLRLPANPTELPDALAWRCPGAVLVFHAPEGDKAAAAPTAVAVAEDEIDLQRILTLIKNGPAAVGNTLPELESLQEEEPCRFEAGVTKVLDYLAAGDVFQVNISRPWKARFERPPDPAVLYNSLCQRNPAPFAGMLRWQDMVLLSSSPERLIEVRGRQVQTRPVAGTRPRGKNLQQDLALAKELINHPKEQAEHVMLIDLERNDLGRVCRPGSVEVNEFMVIESHAHVHHIVSNVRGILRQDAGPVQAIQAVFPGGTITGCPKVRCMQIIAEYEQQGRGFYTGSMGYLDRSGDMDMNILIRSMLLQDNQILFRTGAGIVADSVPAEELQETVDKARGMLLALQAGEPGEKKHA